MSRSAPEIAAYYQAGPSMSALAAAIQAAAADRDDMRGTVHERQVARHLNHMLLDVRIAMEPHLNDLAEKEAIVEAAHEAACAEADREAQEAANEADWERRFPAAANDMAPRDLDRAIRSVPTEYVRRMLERSVVDLQRNEGA